MTVDDVVALAGRGRTTRFADIVNQAIRASGGLGEPWWLEGVTAVRVGNRLLEIDIGDLGWMVTSYIIENGEATPVAVRADESGNPLPAITEWLRTTAGPMHWRRIEPGLYRCGGYLVGQLGTGEWFAEGPGVDRCFDHKRHAQAACAAARHTTG